MLASVDYFDTNITFDFTLASQILGQLSRQRHISKSRNEPNQFLSFSCLCANILLHYTQTHSHLTPSFTFAKSENAASRGLNEHAVL